MRTEFKTRKGDKVTNLQEANDFFVGFVKGKAMIWDKNGRRSPKNRSKLDLNFSNTYHIAIRKWGNTYKSTIYDAKPTGKGIIKVIEVEI